MWGDCNRLYPPNERYQLDRIIAKLVAAWSRSIIYVLWYCTLP